MNIFVGNIVFSAVEADVKKIFEGFGDVTSAVIVKDKKGIKSRGFGFVEMPDDRQALAAIAALNGKEFMGRPLNVGRSRPKTDEERSREKLLRERAKIGVKAQAKAEVKIQGRAAQGKGNVSQKPWFKPVFKKTGGYKGGRRTRSYIAKRIAAGETPVITERIKKDNPMRWRRKSVRPEPWKKTEGRDKPWRKTAEEARTEKNTAVAGTGPKPWKKAEGRGKPWIKAGAGPRPWKSPAGAPKPWRKKPGGHTR